MKNARLLVSSIFLATLLGAVGVVSLSSRTPQIPLEPVSTQSIKPKPGTQPVRWEKDFESAMRAAREKGKPILIDFYTDWCGACKTMDASLYPDPLMAKEAQNWVMIKINAEKRPDVAQAYGVTGYPTIVFAEGSGKPIDIKVGFGDNVDFINSMRAAYSKWNPPAAT